MNALTKSHTKYIAPISEAELACRIAEAAVGIKRKPGLSAEEAIATMPHDWGPAFRNAARAAMEYWSECIQDANRTN